MPSQDLYNPDAEALVLAAILRYPESYWQINQVGLEHRDFVGSENRRIFKAIEEVAGQHRDPDVPSVAELLSKTGSVDTIEYVRSLAGTPSNPTKGADHSRTIKGLSASRRLADVGVKIIETAREAREDYEKAFAEAEGLVRSARDVLPVEPRSPHPKDIIERMRRQGPATTVPIRFSPTLHHYTGGLAPGHFWVIGGMSSVGKSAVACNITDDVIRTPGKHVAIMSLEMLSETYMLRMLSLRSGIPQRELRTKALFDRQKIEALAKAEQELQESNLRIIDTHNTLKGIISAATREKQVNGLDVLIVDFIQNVVVSGGDEFSSARETALALQFLAKELECTVVAFSQLSNAMAQNQENETGYYSFKGSGAIRDACDVGIMLKRNLKNNSPVLRLEVVKNRHDEKGAIDCLMELETGRISEIRTKEDEDYDPDDN